ncbi:MAG: hypothetical protein LBD24_02930 [Spirochaetaceae bacterium]|nr:hypothetical protein [Spirochaetaceae bacterium]
MHLFEATGGHAVPPAPPVAPFGSNRRPCLKPSETAGQGRGLCSRVKKSHGQALETSGADGSGRAARNFQKTSGAGRLHERVYCI